MNTKEFKAYEYYTMMRTAYLWLPVFAIVILISSFFEKIQFLLYTTFGAATYYTIIGKLKKKSVSIIFSKDTVTINKNQIAITEINDYYLCLPLNRLFMLRLNTKNGRVVVYLETECRAEVENILERYEIPAKKTRSDIWLKYSHLKFAFLYLFICFLIFTIYQKFKFSI